MEKLQALQDKIMVSLLKDAKTALEKGDFPQACCLVHNGKIISRASDSRNSSGNKLARAELLLLKECPDYIKDFGLECSFYSVIEPHYSVLPLLVDSGLKSFYFSIYQPEDSPADFIDNVYFFRKKIHHYSSGFHQDEAMELFNRFSDH